MYILMLLRIWTYPEVVYVGSNRKSESEGQLNLAKAAGYELCDEHQKGWQVK